MNRHSVTQSEVETWSSAENGEQYQSCSGQTESGVMAAGSAVQPPPPAELTVCVRLSQAHGGLPRWLLSGLWYATPLRTSSGCSVHFLGRGSVEPTERLAAAEEEQAPRLRRRHYKTQRHQ